MDCERVENIRDSTGIGCSLLTLREFAEIVSMKWYCKKKVKMPLLSAYLHKTTCHTDFTQSQCTSRLSTCLKFCECSLKRSIERLILKRRRLFMSFTHPKPKTIVELWQSSVIDGPRVSGANQGAKRSFSPTWKTSALSVIDEYRTHS